MQIALSSAHVKNKDIPHNLAAMTAALAQAAADGADLVVFGESTLQGFDCLCWSYAADRDMALPLDSAPIRQLQDAAQKYAAAISLASSSATGMPCTAAAPSSARTARSSTASAASASAGRTTAPMNGTAPSSMNTRNRRKNAESAFCSSIPTARTKMLPMPRRAGQSTSATAKFRRRCPRETAGC